MRFEKRDHIIDSDLFSKKIIGFCISFKKRTDDFRITGKQKVDLRIKCFLFMIIKWICNKIASGHKITVSIQIFFIRDIKSKFRGTLVKNGPYVISFYLIFFPFLCRGISPGAIT